MEISMTEQGIVFLFSCAVGFFLGSFYDVFRIIRVAFNLRWLVVFLQDIFFCVVSSLIIILSIYYTNSGRIRLFGLAGCFLFFVLYHLTVGRFIMFISKQIINFIKQVLRFLHSITIKPLKAAALFIAATAKKQAGYAADTGVKIKDSASYAIERGRMSRMAGRGFDLYGGSKRRVSKVNAKLIKKVEKEHSGLAKNKIKNSKTQNKAQNQRRGDNAGKIKTEYGYKK